MLFIIESGLIFCFSSQQMMLKFINGSMQGRMLLIMFCIWVLVFLVLKERGMVILIIEVVIVLIIIRLIIDVLQVRFVIILFFWICCRILVFSMQFQWVKYQCIRMCGMLNISRNRIGLRMLFFSVRLVLILVVMRCSVFQKKELFSLVNGFISEVLMLLIVVVFMFFC